MVVRRNDPVSHEVARDLVDEQPQRVQISAEGPPCEVFDSPTPACAVQERIVPWSSIGEHHSRRSIDVRSAFAAFPVTCSSSSMALIGRSSRKFPSCRYLVVLYRGHESQGSRAATPFRTLQPSRPWPPLTHAPVCTTRHGAEITAHDVYSP